ncbi:unnamed protein product [Moneuplotes crassus]|uniref:Uncharacterized protein n=1 Tax=Euplotes crassus TaxID=5936 RepID=A0AAD1XWK1_EUPCR|nr:unnamed protein product [Moneuplotes crassus]
MLNLNSADWTTTLIVEPTRKEGLTFLGLTDNSVRSLVNIDLLCGLKNFYFSCGLGGMQFQPILN